MIPIGVTQRPSLRPWRLLIMTILLAVCQVVPSRMARAETDPIWTEMVTRLGSPSFDTRSAAMQELIAGKEQALPALAEALRLSQDREVVERCTEVLATFARSDNDPLAVAALDLVNELAKDEAATGARRVRVLQAHLMRVRRQATIQRLRSTGAVLGYGESVAFANAGWLIAPFAETADGDAPVRRVMLDENWQGTTADLELLTQLPEISEVLIDYPNFGSADLSMLARLPEVTHLLIRQADLKDEDLQIIEQFPQLTSVSLMYMPLTDRALDTLASHDSIRWLGLVSLDVTPEHVEAVRQQRADKLVVEVKSGAFLGISPTGLEHQEDGLCLGNITTGAAADRAGLLPGDLVLDFDGTPVKSFDELKECIATKRPGATVPLKIRRGDQVLVKDVKLGKWSCTDWWNSSELSRANAQLMPLVPAVPRVPKK